SLKLLPTAVVLERVSLAPRRGTKLFAADRIEIRVQPLELFRRRVVMDRVVVDGAEVTLDVLDGRVTNLVRPRKREGPPSRWHLEIDRVTLHRGDVRFVARASSGAKGAGLRKVIRTLARTTGQGPATGPA